MFGLTMIRDYLNEILDSFKTFDSRSYPTNKKGKIALIDSISMKIYGTIELVDVDELQRLMIALVIDSLLSSKTRDNKRALRRKFNTWKEYSNEKSI